MHAPQIVCSCLCLSVVRLARRADVDAFMASKYGSLVSSPTDDEFHVAVKLASTDGAPIADGDSLAASVAELGVSVIGCLFRPALQSVAAGGKATDALSETRQVDYRPSESVWLVPRADRLTVVWSLEFPDIFDGALARVIVSELPEMGRRVPASPPTSFYEPVAPPSELAGADVHLGANGVGFVSMSMLAGNVDTPEKMERAIGRLVLFRTYLLYHIKAAKAALHARMRNRVTSWLQVLRRAHPPSASSKASKMLRKGVHAVIATK
jgi:actin related protein 2/3 complex subunit 2